MQQAGKNVNHTFVYPAACLSASLFNTWPSILHRPISMDMSMSFFLHLEMPCQWILLQGPTNLVKLTSLALQTEKVCQILHWVWQSVGKASQGFSLESLSPNNPFVEQREGSNLISRLISTNKKVPLFIAWQTGSIQSLIIHKSFAFFPTQFVPFKQMICRAASSFAPLTSHHTLPRWLRWTDVTANTYISNRPF